MNNIYNHTEQAEKIRLFSAWLAGAYGNLFECKSKNYHLALFRVQKSDEFDYIYYQRIYSGSSIERSSKFEYAGIFCKRDGFVYDADSDIGFLLAEDDDYETRSNDALRRQLKFHVYKAVEKMVGNDRNNLQISELHTEREIKDMEHFKEYSAAGNAREKFLGNVGDDDFAFEYECKYRFGNWTEDSLLEYIADPDGYAEREAAEFFEDNQEKILSAFLKSDMVAEEYSALVNNPALPVHRVKRIMQAVERTSAKTITVTIRIDGTEFTFKTDAHEFRKDCTDYYSDWNIIAADRREFNRIFGNRARYRPEDILRIEYSRNVLYSADVVGNDGG